jgi:hypothetical protein
MAGAYFRSKPTALRTLHPTLRLRVNEKTQIQNEATVQKVSGFCPLFSHETPKNIGKSIEKNFCKKV